MLPRILVAIKPFLTVLVIFGALQATGLMSSVADTSQSALLQTGFWDARAGTVEDKEETFDYGFSVKDLDGKQVSMDQYKGKVIFLNLWATWCGPCRAEMPTIQKLYNGISKENIVFVMLSLDNMEDTPKIAKFIKAKEFNFPVFQPVNTLTQQLKVPSIPVTLVISKTGKIIAKEVGTTNFDTPEFKKFLEDQAAL